MPDFGDDREVSEQRPSEYDGPLRGEPGSDEAARAGQLLGFFAACARATRRQAGVVNVFDAGSPAPSLPADVWERLAEQERYSVRGPEANAMYAQHSVTPSEHPLTLGSLFIVGRHERRAVCAPLLTAPLQVERSGPDEFELSLAEDDLELNFAVLSVLAGGVAAAEEDAFQYQLSELLSYMPEVPLTHENSSVLLRAIGTFMEMPVDGVDDLALFVEADLAEELLVPRLRLMPVHAWFVGREPSAFTVVQELESLTDDADLTDTAFIHGLVPMEVSESALRESTGATEVDLRSPPDPVFDHDIEVLPLTDVQRTIVRAARAYPLTVVTGPPGTGKSYTIAAMIMDQLLGGQKLLMFSHTEKAVEVVVGMLEETCGPFVVARSGNRQSQRDLAAKLDMLLEPGGLGVVPTQEVLGSLADGYTLTKAAFAAKAIEVSMALDLVGGWSHNRDELTELETTGISVSSKALLQDPDRLAAWHGKGLDLLQGGFLRQQWGQRLIRKVRRRLRHRSASADEIDGHIAAVRYTQELEELTSELDNLPGVSELWKELEELESRVHEAAVTLLRAKRSRELGTLLSDPARRTALSHFRAALRAAESVRKRELLAKVPVEILQWAFPCWASTDRFLSHILPLRPRLFDLAVVDEASQCDLAAASPALYRARRAVVVGDPNQLRHVTFLSRSLENSAIVKHQVPRPTQITHNFRRSVFDVASDNVEQEATFLLDEHFRSVPSIIRFPSDRFYRGRLRLMTERPEHDAENAVEVTYLDSPRDSTKGPNTGEANAAVDRVRILMTSGRAVSIGVLSPFRAQVDLMRLLVAETFTTEEIERHQLAVGTAHVLQGDERDVVILSLAMDRHFHHNQLRWLERETGVLNVSITRARRELIVLASMRPRDLPNGLLKDFLLYGESQGVARDLPDMFDTLFEQEVCWAVRDRGYRVFSQYPSAGYKIDLVATNGTKSLGVECDGPTHFNPNGEYRPEDVARHMVLARAGWQLLRIPYDGWRRDPQRYVSEVDDFFGGAVSPGQRIDAQ